MNQKPGQDKPALFQGNRKVVGTRGAIWLMLVRIISTGRTLEAPASEASDLPGRGRIRALRLVGQNLDVHREQHAELSDGLLLTEGAIGCPASSYWRRLGGHYPDRTLSR